MICGKCGSGNVALDGFSHTGFRCLVCGSRQGFIDPVMSDDQNAVMNIISEHRGKGNEVKRQEISRITGLGDVAVRRAISQLVNGHGKLIGSNGNGYYVPATPKEISEITRSLRHRGIMILMRAAQIQKSSLDEVFRQGELELKSAALQ